MGKDRMQEKDTDVLAWLSDRGSVLRKLRRMQEVLGRIPPTRTKQACDMLDTDIEQKTRIAAKPHMRCLLEHDLPTTRMQHQPKAKAIH